MAHGTRRVGGSKRGVLGSQMRPGLRHASGPTVVVVHTQGRTPGFEPARTRGRHSAFLFRIGSTKYYQYISRATRALAGYIADSDAVSLLSL
jgi:hypothetical protein